MVDLNKILKNKQLVEQLTGLKNGEFKKELQLYLKLIHSKRLLKVIDTPEKQLFFIKFMEYISPTQTLAAQIFGIKRRGRQRINSWIKVLEVQKHPSKFSKLGEFLSTYPDIQLVLTHTEFHLPYQLTTTPIKEEMKRFKKVVNTLDSRILMLLEFREDILGRPQQTSIDTYTYSLYTTKYMELEELNIKELAYLWGVSIEYMTRVLNTAKNKLLSIDINTLKEKLIYDY